MNLINRELSWLSFNERVLQEAMDPTVPLTERMRFLGIYSNNLDEFFRVRVANLKRAIEVKNEKVQGFDGTAEELYVKIRKVVLKQQALFESTYAQIKSEFEAENVHFIDERACTDKELAALDSYFREKLKHAIFPILLDKKRPLPKLRDYAIYLGVKIVSKAKVRYVLIQIPTDYSRFFILPKGERTQLILIDDIIRLYLKEIFAVYQANHIEAYTFKFTRDAELDLDDDLSLSFFEKIEKSLKQRKKGQPVRFVYDAQMPDDLLQFLLLQLNLKKGVNTIPGGRYHNFKDFMRFPDFGVANYRFEPQPPVGHPDLIDCKSLIAKINEKDVLLHFPYQQFDHVVDLLREASLDAKVKEVKINIYRVAKNSEVMNALLACIFNGKHVTVVFELQARFDEENNLERHTFRNLLVSPFNTRRKLMALVDREIKWAKAKKPAYIRMKFNNLTDIKMIDKLYAAGKAGVQIELIIRGICCLKPGVKGLSENITAISIVDRYLEHTRFFIFSNNGKPEYFISSADWMERNLDQRIEVGTIVKDPTIQAQIDLIFDFQWRGSVKARSISADYKNAYSKRNLPPFHAQKELYEHYMLLSQNHIASSEEITQEA